MESQLAAVKEVTQKKKHADVLAAESPQKAPEPSLTFDLSFLSTADAVVTLRHDGGGWDTEWTDRGRGPGRRDTGWDLHMQPGWPRPAGLAWTSSAEQSSSRHQSEHQTRAGPRHSGKWRNLLGGSC